MNNVVKKDIHITYGLLNDRHFCNHLNQYGVFKTIYPFSNEDLISCFDKFDFKDKKVLSVLASSDQVIDMYLRGASKVDTFDINRLTIYYYYLKIAALKHDLPVNFFIDYFNTYNQYNPYYMGLRTFNKIKDEMDDINKTYWEYVFDNYNSDEIASNLFSHDSSCNRDLVNQILYLNSEDNFDNAKKNVTDIRFIPTDLKRLRGKIYDSYDYIYLSNIMQYVCEMYCPTSYIKSLFRFKKLIENLAHNLNDDGKIINYIFNSNIIEKQDIIKYIFDSYYYSYIDLNSTDSILVYTKKC